MRMRTNSRHTPCSSNDAFALVLLQCERIVTGDETWVSHITPESKRQSMEWRHTNSPVRVKAKRTISTRKVMATVFWDRHGVLLVEFMQQGTTINAAAYCATL
ncbi:uncharacterized protein TNCV_2026341 [Trichonephila clavipes]|nr:uncharacterized protein TNCV_2026341 [Trichonephila clavipes]